MCFVFCLDLGLVICLFVRFLGVFTVRFRLLWLWWFADVVAWFEFGGFAWFILVLGLFWWVYCVVWLCFGVLVVG